MTNEYNYSLQVKNGAGWRFYNCVRLPISVGKEYHEENKLVAVVNWINKNPSITKVQVSVNDALQRHNLLAEGLSEKQAMLMTLAEGSLWIARNRDILSDIKASVEIMRWNDWFGTPAFSNAFSALKEYKNIDPDFVTALNDDACALATRRVQRGEVVPLSLIDHSRDYVEEELAVFALQSKALPAAEVYPGSNLRSADYFLKLGNPSKVPEILRPLTSRHFTRVDFDRKSPAQPVYAQYSLT